MIFDRMERLPQYRGLNPNLDKLIDFALSRTPSSLVPGRNDIDGDECWMGNNAVSLVPQTSKYERHMEYIDLQIPLEEGEIIEVLPVEALEWPADDRETRFTDGPAGLPLDMTPGCFAIFFPGDAHCCGPGPGAQVGGQGEGLIPERVSKMRNVRF